MTTKASPTDTRPKPSTGRLLAIVAVFALLGPPIGGLVLSASLASLAAAPKLAASDWLEAGRTFLTLTLFGSTFGLAIAYAVGILPAAAVGLAVAIWERRNGLLSWRVAIAAALVPWLFIASRAGEIGASDEGTQVAQVVILVAHLAAAMACWWLARAIVDRSSPLR